MDIYMSDPIISQLNFEVYVAENEYFNRIAMIHNRLQIMSESESYQALNESFFDVIKKYIEKITTAITTAWNKFKSISVKAEITELINKNKKFLDSAFRMMIPKDFAVPDLEKWNEINDYIGRQFKQSTFDQAKFRSWKQGDFLESPEKFLNYIYPTIMNMGTQDMSIADKINNAVFGESKKTQTEILVADKIKPYSEWLLTYPDQLNKISANLEVVNASNKNVEQALKSLQNVNASYIEYDFYKYLAEEGENQQSDTQATSNQNAPTPQVNTTTASTTPDNTFKSADGDNPNKIDSAEDRKAIVNYYKANTSILSAQMKTCNQIRSASERLVKNFIRLQTHGGPQEEKKETGTENNSSITVDTSTAKK